MNKTALLLAATMAALIGQSHNAAATPKCSLKTLKGTYIYWARGLKGTAINVEGGQEIYDGKGGIVNTYTGLGGRTEVTTGTYTMKANCIGQAHYQDSQEAYAIYTGPQGGEFTWIGLSKDNNITGSETRVSTSVTPKCSLRTLKGSYIYSQIGFNSGISYIESGQDLFDGKGGITNTYTVSGGETRVTAGSYTMNANCIGASTFAGSGNTYVIYTGPQGAELRFVSEGNGSHIAGGAEHRVSKDLIK